MKKLIITLSLILIPLIQNVAQARNTLHMYSVSDALNTEAAKQKLGGDIAFYFGDQPHPKQIKYFGEYQSNKKTNAFNKTDRQACDWAFLSAMLSLQDRARQLGANAVVNIRSYYKKHLVSSRTKYECGAGGIIAGVTLKGDFVTLAK